MARSAKDTRRASAGCDALSRTPIHPNVIVRSAVVYGVPPQRTRTPIQRFARGTREDLRPSIAPVPAEDTLGDRWFYSFALETMGRNIAMAAGLTLAYKLGLAHAEFEKMRKVNS